MLKTCQQCRKEFTTKKLDTKRCSRECFYSYMTGRTVSEETRRKISEANLGKSRNLGRELSEEHRKNISEAKKKIGVPWCIGVARTEETKQKISEASKGRPNFKLRGEKNYCWKGEEVGYRSLHMWVERYLGKPDTCTHCKRSNLSGHLIHWASKSRQYKRDLEDWLRLCAKCHRQYDSR